MSAQAINLKLPVVLSFLQAIIRDDLPRVKQWFTTHVKRQDINKFADRRDGKEKNLKATVKQKGMTALCYAAFFGRLEIVDFLLGKGAGMCLCVSF